MPATALLFALLWPTRVIRDAHAASHVPSDTAGEEHDTPTPVLVRPCDLAVVTRPPPVKVARLRTHTSFSVFVSSNTKTSEIQNAKMITQKNGMGWS